MEPFHGNSQHVKAVDSFLRGAPSLMFDGILGTTLSKEKISTTGVTRWNVELFLPPISPYSHHQTQIR